MLALFLVAATVLVAVMVGARSAPAVAPKPPPKTATFAVAREPAEVAVVAGYEAELTRSLEEWLAELGRQHALAQAEAEARAAEEAARSAPTSSAGAHSDAWWRAVAVCEQSGENDPFFGYFSIMDGSAGGLDWATQVAMANGIIARYGDGAWAASCVAAGYAAAPGG